jgi:serine/threonine-protein kinase
MTFRDGTKSRNVTKGSLPTAQAEQRASGATYRELLPIGSGGTANITIALAEGIAGFSKLVVLKTIREELVANNSATTMFLDEARLSARMNHPNVVQVYEVFLRRQVPVIVMEFLDGQPLSAILAQAHASKSYSLETAISILSKVLAGLHYAHTLTDFSGQALGLIHRDVSPHNVMVTYDGQVKLVDFGIAKLATSEHQTRTGVIKGKLTYMAPEQFTGKVDARADLFGVGVMLWELATRQRFWGELPEPALIGKLISGDLPHLKRPAGIDDELYRICSRALAFRLDERYEHAAAMQEDLERYLATRGAVVTQATIGRLVTETCAEARKKVQNGIREQLSQHGLSLTGSFDGLLPERGRGKLEANESSGERLRRKVDANETRGSAGDQTSTGGLRQKIVEQTTTGGLRQKIVEQTTTGGSSRKANDQTSTGGLRQKVNDATISGALRSAASNSKAGLDPAQPDAAEPASDASGKAPPLRLFGGAAPTARAGVALAGFGTLGVLILALGLATPDDPNKVPSPAAAAAATAAPLPAGPRSVRIVASAQPPEASWYLDDQKQDANPLQISVPVDGAVHTLRAEAPGFEPYIKSVKLEADVDITVSLSRK